MFLLHKTRGIESNLNQLAMTWISPGCIGFQLQGYFCPGTISKEPLTSVLEDPLSTVDVVRFQPDTKQENVSLIYLLLIKLNKEIMH